MSNVPESESSQNKAFKIKFAEPKDAKDLRFLIQELANFEKLPDGPKITAEQLAADLERDEPAAMTIFYNAYSTWEGQMIHMEDLYVREKFRRNKLANQLVKAVVNFALEKGMKRLNWTVLNWNDGAIQFYKKLGATNLHEEGGWLPFRLNEEQMKNLVKTNHH
uniref:N-acetyltransferase domain-containing protein n=1 Tax=Ditylenchus dipsaci TaxID=166011 RepID=A0A915EU15_9BILA